MTTVKQIINDNSVLIKYDLNNKGEPTLKQIYWSNGNFTINRYEITIPINTKTAEINDSGNMLLGEYKLINGTLKIDPNSHYVYIGQGQGQYEYWPEVDFDTEINKINEKITDLVTTLKLIAHPESENQDLFLNMLIFFSKTIRKVLTIPVIFKISSLDATSFNNLKLNNADLLTQLIDIFYISTSSNDILNRMLLYEQNEETIKKVISDNTIVYLKLKNNVPDPQPKPQEKDLHVFIIKVIESIENLAEKWRKNKTVFKVPFINEFVFQSEVIKIIHGICDSVSESSLKINNLTTNIVFIEELDKLIKEQNNNRIMTYVKINKFTDDRNRRYEVELNKKLIKDDKSEKTQLIVSYNPTEKAYYKKVGNSYYASDNIENCELLDAGKGNKELKFCNPDSYKYKYLLGKFNKVFEPSDKSKDIAKEMYDQFYNGNEDGFKPLIILGYGASGSGKTSSLIYLNSRAVEMNDEDRNGVIIELCKLLKENKNMTKIDVESDEYYKNNNMSDKENPTVIKRGSYEFTYKDKDNSFVSKYPPEKIRHPYREPDLLSIGTHVVLGNTDNAIITNIENGKYDKKIYTIKFKDGSTRSNIKEYKLRRKLNLTSLAETLVYLSDKDRFVKATLNNPTSSRSHSIINLLLSDGESKKINIFICDLAGIENNFTCDQIKTQIDFLNLKRQESHRNDRFYYLTEINERRRETYTDPVDSIEPTKNDEYSVTPYPLFDFNGFATNYKDIIEKFNYVNSNFSDRKDTWFHYDSLNTEDKKEMQKLKGAKDTFNLTTEPYKNASTEYDNAVFYGETVIVKMIKKNIKNFYKSTKDIPKNDIVTVISIINHIFNNKDINLYRTPEVQPYTDIFEKSEEIIKNIEVVENYFKNYNIEKVRDLKDLFYEKILKVNDDEHELNDLKKKLDKIKIEIDSINITARAHENGNKLKTYNSEPFEFNTIDIYDRYLLLRLPMDMKEGSNEEQTLKANAGHLNKIKSNSGVKNTFHELSRLESFIKSNHKIPDDNNYKKMVALDKKPNFTKIIGDEYVGSLENGGSYYVNFKNWEETKKNFYKFILDLNTYNNGNKKSDFALCKFDYYNALLMFKYDNVINVHRIENLREDLLEYYQELLQITNLEESTENFQDELVNNMVFTIKTKINNLKNKVDTFMSLINDKINWQTGVDEEDSIPQLNEKEKDELNVIIVMLTGFNYKLNAVIILLDTIQSKIDNTTYEKNDLKELSNAMISAKNQFEKTKLTHSDDAIKKQFREIIDLHYILKEASWPLYDLLLEYKDYKKLNNKNESNLENLTTQCNIQSVSIDDFYNNGKPNMEKIDEVLKDLENTRITIFTIPDCFKDGEKCKKKDQSGTFLPIIPVSYNLLLKEYIAKIFKPFHGLINKDGNLFWTSLFKSRDMYYQLQDSFFKTLETNKTMELVTYSIKLAKDIITDVKNQIEYAQKICNNRSYEGNYIRESLLNIRDTIREMLIEKNNGIINSSPNFIDICLEAYCPTHTNCFAISNDNKQSNEWIPSQIFSDIYKKIKKSKVYGYKKSDFYKEIIVTVFCFFNISISTIEPPPVPYIDINKLKKDWNSGEDIKNSLTNVLKFIKSDVYFKNSLPPEIISHINDVLTTQQIQKSRISKEYENIINDFITAVDNNNSASPIGTLEFIDKIAKFNSINNICSKDTIKDDSTIEDYKKSNGFVLVRDRHDK